MAMERENRFSFVIKKLFWVLQNLLNGNFDKCSMYLEQYSLEKIGTKYIETESTAKEILPQKSK